MRLAVNDNVSVYGIVRDFREVIPVELDDLLDWDRAEG
jgi:hypothetical protein